MLGCHRVNGSGTLKSTRLTLNGPARPLDRALREHYALTFAAEQPGAEPPSWNAVRKLIATGKVTVDGERVLDPTRLVGEAAEVAVAMEARRVGDKPTHGLPASCIVHKDAHLVVVHKPAHIPTVPYEGMDLGDTLDELTRRLLGKLEPDRPRQPKLGVVQRLDKETSGLLVFARSPVAKQHLQQQLRVHSMERRYLAVAAGAVRAGSIRTRLVRDRGDGHRGSTELDFLGRESVTHVDVVERLPNATLIGCRLETGRTHQIRIHLSEQGHPLVGERVYSKGHEAIAIAAPRILLHATLLGFVHPVSGKTLRFEAPMPEDMQAALLRLRAGQRP